MIEFLDPYSAPEQAVQRYTLGLGDRIVDGPVRIGLLANGFADSETFLDAVQGALHARLAAASFVRARKPSPTVLVDDDTFDDLVARCDAIVSAYGH